MSICDLTIELDRPHRSYAPGDIVSGHVEVDVDEAVQCQNLQVSCQWSASAGGSCDEGSRQASTLVSGSWSPDKNHQYRFEFQLPDGPCSYAGHRLDVDWFVRARAEDSEGELANTECIFDVAPRPLTSEQTYCTGDPASGSHQTAGDRDYKKTTQSGCLTTVWLLAVVLCAMLLLVAISGASTDSPISLLLIAVPVALLAVIGRGFYTTILRNKIAELQLGKRLFADIETAAVHAGDALAVTVDIPKESTVHINEITVALKAREWLREPTDTDDPSQNIEIFDRQWVLPDSLDRHLAKGQSAQLGIDIDVPADATPSFSCRDAAIRWSVEVYIDIEDWPNWSEEIPVDILPPQRSKSTSENTSPPDSRASTRAAQR